MNKDLKNEWNLAYQFFQFATNEKDIDKAIEMLSKIEKEMGLEKPKYE